MFQQVLNYAGEYKKTTYLSIAVMLSGIIMNILPFWFLYQLLRPLLTGEDVGPEYILARILAIAVCGVLYAFLYVKGLSLSHPAEFKDFPAGKAGRTAPGRHPGEGHWILKEDVH